MGQAHEGSSASRGNSHLRQTMIDCRVTIEQLAAACEVDPKSVERWLNSDRVPHERNRILAAKYLNKSEIDLWPAVRRRGDLVWHPESLTDDTPTQSSADLASPGRKRGNRTRLQLARKAAGLTQEQLAERLHVDRTSVICWEAGERTPQPYMWSKLANLLGVSSERLAELLSEENESALTDSAATHINLEDPDRIKGDSVKAKSRPTLLKELLRKRHMLTYRLFCREFERVAGRLDRRLASSVPGERQYARWIGGQILRLPYPEACTVLEAMFPGYTAEQLFSLTPPPEPESTAMMHPTSGGSGETIVVPTCTVDGETVTVKISRRLFLQGVGYGSVSIASDSRLKLSATANIAQEFSASISSGDPGPLAQVQTTYNVDQAIASMVDIDTRNRLRRWAVDLGNPIARVNAAGILAKIANQGESDLVIATLQNDEEVRRLYLIAVTARICAVNWDEASKFVRDPTGFSFVSLAAERFAHETINPADVGARWCSAKMLQDLSGSIGR